MQQQTGRIATTAGAMLMMAMLGLLTGGAGLADDGKQANTARPESPKPDMQRSLVATSAASQPLNLLLTQAELAAVVRSYEIKTGEVLTSPIDEEVLVTAPGYVAPMRDVSQDAWGGIAAPFWAVVNPKGAWRIFVPIPPKGGAQESERPAPDPR